MRKTLLLCLCLAVLLPLLASAQEVEWVADAAPLSLPMERVDSPQHASNIIMRMTAPNGQVIHFVSQCDQPVARALDLNFDGAGDLAVLVSPGGTNEVYRFFLLEGGRFVPAEDGMETGLYNPALDPKNGLVISHGVSGLAGALHEINLLRWDGARLAPVRSALCQEYTETTFEENTHIIKTWADVLHAKVFAYPSGDWWNRALVFEETYNMKAQGMEDAYTAFYQREQEALWQGLTRPEAPKDDGDG